jgi:hypothetical protein
MDAQEFRNLQEAYMEVVENRQLDEDPVTGALIGGALGIAAGAKGARYAAKNTKRLRDYPKNFVKGIVDPRTYVPKKKKEQKEEADLYDIILSHLLDEGYADTQEAAEAIMVNMSEDWRESICEGLGGAKNQGDYDEMERKRKEVRDEHLRKYKSEELPFQKQKKADQAQDFLKKYPKKKK